MSLIGWFHDWKSLLYTSRLRYCSYGERTCINLLPINGMLPTISWVIVSIAEPKAISPFVYLARIPAGELSFSFSFASPLFSKTWLTFLPLD